MSHTKLPSHSQDTTSSPLLNVNFWSFHLFYQGRSNAIAKLLSLFFFLLLCNSYLRNHFSIWIESFFPCYLNSSATPFYLRMQLAMQSAEQIQILNKAVQGWVISGLKILHITVFSRGWNTFKFITHSSIKPISELPLLISAASQKRTFSVQFFKNDNN